MRNIRRLAGIIAFLSGLAALSFTAAPVKAMPGPQPAGIPDYCRDAKPAALPLPSAVADHVYQKQLLAFLNARAYATYGWCVDKAMDGNLVRDTGPFIKGVYYGTHPAVRIYYSPEMMEWIVAGDREKPPADGAIIIKEMFEPPAARYEGMDDAQVTEKLRSWTVMVRDGSASRDGWYWSNPAKGASEPDGHGYPFTYPESGFGQYCVRCHSSAKDFQTFTTIRNIKGFPGDPIRYKVDDSWRDLSDAEKPWQPHTELKRLRAVYQDLHNPQERRVATRRVSLEPSSPDPAFLRQFSSVKTTGAETVLRIPDETQDRVVAPAAGDPGFISSDQCMSCHGGLNGNEGSGAGPVMFLQTGRKYGDGYNISPYGEWRWSPMGLAGRDPIFHAQLDSEITLIRKEFGKEPAKADNLVRRLENLCLTCHAVMGQRQLAEDAKTLGLDPLFKRDYLYLSAEQSDNPYHKYGALGRDGISCAVCHRMTPSAASDDVSALRDYLTNATTGRFDTGPSEEIYGPFKDDEIVTWPMKNAVGIEPKHNEYIKSARLCGSCHTVTLPNLDMPLGETWKRTMLDDGQPDEVFRDFKHSVEQATYLEWLNSGYQNEFPDANPTPERAQTCQGCHMPTDFKSADGRVKVKQIKTRIAAIQDETYPEADHMAPVDDLRVRFREEGFRRHRLQGLNAMLVQIFKQANDILGVRTADYMTGADGIDLALDEYAQQARERTADIDIAVKLREPAKLSVDVTVTNKAGHRFPSGVGFRRAFIELLVIDNSTGRERVVWGSGRTNSVGAIVDETGEVLPTEFFERGTNGEQRYQPHHLVITGQNQVQIYEELIKNAKGEFTTSFVHRAKHIKDNRLLPFGWKEKGPQPERYQDLKYFIDATHPGQDAVRDEDYRDGSGRDIVRYEIALPEGTDTSNLTVRATLYYQSIPPSWLKQRFETAPHMAATQRLHYIASRLQLDGTPLENWKFRLVSTNETVRAP